MVFYYVIFIIYNFLMSDSARTLSSPISETVNTTVHASNVQKSSNLIAVFKNHALTPPKIPNEAQIAEWTKLAKKHITLMTSDSVRCAVPMPKVIKVTEVHHHASMRFLPSCVILHRCDHKTGCCEDENKVCTVRKRNRVSMYFFAMGLQPTFGQESAVRTNFHVERLHFSNHTECECQPRKIRIKTTQSPPILGQSSSGVDGSNKFGSWLHPIIFIITLAPFLHLFKNV